jgi:acetylornithine deacetylase
LAAALVAAAAIEPGELAGDVIVAAVADEEYASLGTEALVREWSADAAVVLEPTQLMICPSHRGFAVIDATFHGKAAHTSRPDRGINAVHAAAASVRAVEQLDAAWSAESDDITRRPSTLISRIESGSETFTVPPRCAMVVEVRTTAADPTGQAEAAMEAVRSACLEPATVDVGVAFARPPLGTPDDHPLVIALVDALAGTDSPVLVGGAPFWTDAALHAEAGTPAVVFGPAGEGLHEDEEWVTVSSLQVVAAALEALARTWCT